MKKAFVDLSDETLVKNFVETQNNKYFEAIYDRFSEKIYRKCYSFVKNTAQAEDYMHDIFLKLIVNLGNFKENAKLSTYIYAITYNHCVDNSNSRKKVKMQELTEDLDFAEEDWSEVNQFDPEKLDKAMDEITAEDKSIVLLKYQDGLSIKEIGEIFNISESAVKMRLKRAKEKIQKFYLMNFLFFGMLLVKVIMFLKS